MHCNWGEFRVLVEMMALPLRQSQIFLSEPHLTAAVVLLKKRCAWKFGGFWLLIVPSNFSRFFFDRVFFGASTYIFIHTGVGVLRREEKKHKGATGFPDPTKETKDDALWIPWMASPKMHDGHLMHVTQAGGIFFSGDFGSVYTGRVAFTNAVVCVAMQGLTRGWFFHQFSPKHATPCVATQTTAFLKKADASDVFRSIEVLRVARFFKRTHLPNHSFASFRYRKAVYTGVEFCKGAR